MIYSIENKVKSRIFGHRRGWCFTPAHFMDLGSDSSVRQALSQLRKRGLIRRLAQGVYDYPKIHGSLGIVPADLNAAAKAIAEKNGVQIQPAGAFAANLAGLSTQVPGRMIFLTEGPSRKIKIGNHEIVFKKTSAKIMQAAGSREGLLIQAIKNTGKENLDENIRKKIKRLLSSSNEQEIRKNLKFAPAWIRNEVFKIMGLKL